MAASNGGSKAPKKPPSIFGLCKYARQLILGIEMRNPKRDSDLRGLYSVKCAKCQVKL